MREQIEEIARSIQRHRELELHCEINNLSIGRSFALYNKDEHQFWLIHAAAQRIHRRDFLGNVVPGYGYLTNKPLEGDGHSIPRDSKLGGILIQNHEGKHSHSTPSGEIEIEIFNRASFIPSLTDGEFAIDILIKIAGDSRSYSFQNIAKILSLQLEIDEEKEKLGIATYEAAKQLIERIEKKEEEKKIYLAKAQGFIRKYAQLRFQPILDPIQDSIRRSKVFEGTLIINGGPGTGKTTSLIQRIKYLISPTIEEEVTLTPKQRDILFNQNTSWIFYSPNDLLALFLRNSMKMEDLIADSERVKVWSSHKNELVKSYKLVDTTTRKPFLIYNKAHDESLIINSPESVRSIIDDFLAYFLAFQKEKIERVLDIDARPFKWKNTGISIQNFLQKRKKIDNLEDLLRLFFNLNITYKVESEKFSEEYASLIKQVAARIQVEILGDTARAATLSYTLSSWADSLQGLEEDDEGDEEIESEDFDEKEDVKAIDSEKNLFVKLKSICRKKALLQFDKNIKLSRHEKELIKIIPEVEIQPEYELIGQLAFFKKYFDRIIKGVIANVFREIPMNYKRFRRGQLNNNNKHFNLNILKDLVENDKNSRIHSDEQALLLYFVNTICYKLAKSYKRQYDNLSHPYLNAYKAHCKPVIGVDEATDFSLIDLLTIESFGHPSISSLTLSGDVMQRMSKNGIRTWSELIAIIPNSEIKNLEVSYRQSPTLLALAQKIYEISLGKEAEYSSYMENDEAEPKPLMLVSENEGEKLNWIADRIIEIYKAYGDSIPSIAIFLPEENMLESFASKLDKVDTLADVGIYVKACRNGEILGDDDTVRVFSIDKIKGLEFEAVFFHNLDAILYQNLSDDLLLQYLYVGLSRATFYLGLTLSKDLTGKLAFLNTSFDGGSTTWK